MSVPPDYKVLSWRDPDGHVVGVGGRIFRAIDPAHAESIKTLLGMPWMTQLISEGLIPKTTEASGPPPGLSHGAEGHYWVEHELVPFACYPHEITAFQLYDSAMLTLRVALAAAQHGWVLKDASASNVLHSYGKCYFVDLLSFERQGTTGTWIAYGQFVRNFILPLLLYQKLGITPPDIFLTHRDGVTPEHAYELLHGLQLLASGVLEHVLLPKWLTPAGGRLIASEAKHNPRNFKPEIRQELLIRTLRRLQRTVNGLRPDKTKSASVWKEYEEDRAHYSEPDLAAKVQFVGANLEAGGTVLDLGCNAGEFSLLAAGLGKSVVAADADHPALSRLYSRVRGSNSPIAPVILNIGRPTPAVGWGNDEVPSFLQRAAGYFDSILVLGLIHHLLVSERASMTMLADFLAGLRPKTVILEWVDPKDPKFRQLAGLNGSLYSALDESQLELCFSRKFSLVTKSRLPCRTRVMYLWSQ